MGHYYGSCPPGEAVSFTELEYRTATGGGPASADVRRARRLPDPGQPARIRRLLRAPAGASPRGDERTGGGLVRHARAARERGHQGAVRLARGAAASRAASGAAGDAEAPGQQRRPQAEKPLGANPYRGLEAFRKEDADRFFGREALVDQLWNAFLALHAAPTDGEAPIRLLAILGASGSGKSSVAQAGLLAELEQRPLPGRPAPIEVVFTPEARPLESLAVALARQATDDPAPAKKASEFEEVLRTRESHDGLRYLAERMLDVGGGGLILLVDQFEELYSLCDDEQERAAFIGNLLTAAREPRGRVSIILTLRSDFLGAINQHPELSRLIARQNVLVPVMGEDELRRAIEEPAKRAGREIDQSTVDLLIEQTLGREGALPALEFVLTRIWDGFRQGVSSADTVRELGGVGGALAKEAKRIYQSLSADQKTVARRAFLAMTMLGEGTKDTRRRASIDEMIAAGQSEADVRRVLEIFADPDRRLITLAADKDGRTIAEVAHEALFDHWAELTAWLDQDRDDIRFHRRLDGRGRRTGPTAGRPEGLLWRPPAARPPARDLRSAPGRRHAAGWSSSSSRLRESQRSSGSGDASGSRARAAQLAEQRRAADRRQVAL